MGLLTDLNKRIEKKQDERWELQRDLDRMHAKAFALDAVIEELESFAKVVAKEEAGADGATGAADIKLRPGSDVYNAREALRKLGKPSELGQLLATMGKHDTKEIRRSVSSQMAWYARKNQIFTRPEPGFWGLYEWEQTSMNFTVEANGDPTALPLNPEDVREPAH